METNQFTVYVLFSKKHNKIYVGYTSNLINRFKSHNELAKKGYTSRFRPWMVVHTEVFWDKTLAMKREKQLKSARGRMYIKNEIVPNF